MKTLLCLALLALTACAHTQPGVEVRTVTVDREVQRPCPGTVPVRPAPLGALPDDANAALAQVLGKLAEYSGPGKYADKASLYFKTCPPAAPIAPQSLLPLGER